jgi:predicted dehydrogenase
MPVSRRTFLLSSTAPLLAQNSSPDATPVGIIGSGGRGRLLTQLFRRDEKVKFLGVCDVYEPNLEAGLSAAGPGAHAYRNYKALLDSKEIKVVIIATPEHWHHQMFLDALAAGKDIYVEKPFCQRPEQGIEMIDAARKSKSVVQVGMQRRSYDMYVKAGRIIQGGELGKVRMVRAWWLNSQVGDTTGKLTGPLDWEQWQGPAEKRPLDPKRFLNWRAYSEYSGGIMADQGAHVFDGIHMLMNIGYPSSVVALGGTPHKPGVDTADTVVVASEYPQDVLATFTINYAAMRYKTVNDQLNSYDGDKARMDVARESYAVYQAGAEEQPTLNGTGKFSQAVEQHIDNFLECVRTRATPNGTPERAFEAALVTQMANMSIAKGRRIQWDAAARKVKA